MTNRQEILLCAQCIEWIRRLEQIVKKIVRQHQSLKAHAIEFMQKASVGEAANPDFTSSAEIADNLQDACLIPIILTHIYRASQLLKPNINNELDHKISCFANMYNSNDLQNIRNVLEHLEEYIVGEGHKPDLIVNSEPNPTFSSGPGGELFLGIFGRRYNIGMAIQSALSLHDIIHAHREHLCGR